MKCTLLVCCVLLMPITLADLGPKPEAHITVLYEGKPVDGTFWARMLDCRGLSDEELVLYGDRIATLNASDACPDELRNERNEQAFSDCKKLQAIVIDDPEKKCLWLPAPTAWDGRCEASACSFTYFLPSEFRLAVLTNNTTFVTQAISRDAFISSYAVELFQDGRARIREGPSGVQYVLGQYVLGDRAPAIIGIVLFLLSVVLTILIELFGAFVFVAVKRFSYKFLWVVVLANCITLPLIWFVFPRLNLSGYLTIILSELFVVCAEAALYLLHRNWSKDKRIKYKLSWRQAIWLSVVLNLASLLFGGFLLYGRLL